MPLQVERDTCRSEFRTRDGAVVLAPPACSTAAGRGLRLHGCSFRLRPCRLLLILRDPPAPLPNLRRRLLGPLQPTQLRSLHPDSLLQGPWVPLGTQKLLHLQAGAKARRVRQDGSGQAADGMQREEARWSGQAADGTQIEEASKPNQPEPIYAHEQWSPTINSPMEKDVLEYVGIERVEELIGRTQTRKK